jgi:hypothetical protein
MSVKQVVFKALKTFIERLKMEILQICINICIELIVKEH